MTDGIIQQIFKKILHETIIGEPVGKYRLEQLQHELIEKIKQEFRLDLSCGCPNCEGTNYVVKKLIGDNKE